MVSVIKNVGSEVSKVFEKLVKNRIVGHLEKCCIFSDFQYGFRSSQSTADLVTVVPDRIVRTFNRSVATPALAFDISKASDSGSLFFFTQTLILWNFRSDIWPVIFSFHCNRQLQVVLDGKSSQEYSVNAGVPQGSKGPTS